MMYDVSDGNDGDVTEDDDGTGFVFQDDWMMIMMVMIYFWYISNILSLYAHSPLPPKVLNVKKKEVVL